MEQVDLKEIISATSSHGFAKAIIMSEHQNLPNHFINRKRRLLKFCLPERK